MEKLKAYKFRLDPNLQQQIFFNKNIGCCRLIYNLMLNEKQENYKMKVDIENIENMYNCIHQKLKFKNTTEKEFKTKYEFLKEIDSISLQQSRLDLDKAYQNFFRKLKLNQKTRLRFKSKKNPKESYRTQNINNNIEVKENKIKLPKIGYVKFKKSREVKGKIKNVTITKTKLNKYYISICCEEFIREKPKLNKSIGIDLGLKSFAVTSDNESFANPKFLRGLEGRLKRSQRKLSRKIQRKLDKKEKVEGKNLEKNRIELCKIHEKIFNQRNDFLHKLSSKIINENQVICIEDLKVKNMVKNHKLAKSISDASWSRFVEMLIYKADWYGRSLVKVSTFFPSSKTCSSCGEVREKLDLSERVFRCDCGLEIDRDFNASLNILKQGLILDRNRRAGEVSLVNTFSLEKDSQEFLPFRDGKCQIQERLKI
jgi:putative transposase